MMICIFLLFTFWTIFLIVGCEDHFDLVIKANIPLESHYVTTEDGYILNMFRLTQANSSKVMFLMHGLLASATTYVAISKNTSAGFFFHSLGYDVWMGNARGNKFSRNHTTLDPEEKPFWEFSWHEIGYYDLPAMIDYVLAVTDQSNLSYIGHSQGVTSVFVMLAERPEYNAKIKLFHAMTPPVIMKYFNKYFQPMANAVASLEGWEKMLGYYEIFPYDATKWLFNYYAEFCKYSLTKDLCKKTFEISIGPFAPNSYSKEYAFVFKRLMMFGCSYKQIMHYFQLSLTDRFQKFDFGSEENQRIYGSTQPPEYNISNFRVPTHILYGTSDYLAMASNIPALLKKIDHMVIAVDKFDSFNHLDFVNGRLVQSVQTRILNVIKKFEQ